MTSSSRERATTHDQPLAGRRYLVLEDDYLIATALADMLMSQGASVAGPVASVIDAGHLLEKADRLDGAIVDINVAGTVAYGIVELLEERGVPCIFVTGYKASGIPERFSHIPCIEKPTGCSAIIDALRRLPGGHVVPGA